MPLRNSGNPPLNELADDEPYVISDERLAEIKGLINWQHAGWQTIPSRPSVTVYDLAAAVEDLLAEREEIEELLDSALAKIERTG